MDDIHGVETFTTAVLCMDQVDKIPKISLILFEINMEDRREQIVFP